MDLQKFKLQRESLLLENPKYRDLCMQCMQPQFGCYCQHVKTFDPKIKFVILIHPIEVKRRIATGRMSHLCLENSELIMGQNYSENTRVNQILENPQYQPLVLYPGQQSLNLSETAATEKKENLFVKEKTPVIFVIDGTWATARKTMRQSLNLNPLPRICFTPPGPSQFRVRKQPKENCYSTIEAVHHTIELLGEKAGFNTLGREHDGLIEVFNKLVERQLEFMREAFDNPNSNSYRRVRRRVA